LSTLSRARRRTTPRRPRPGQDGISAVEVVLLAPLLTLLLVFLAAFGVLVDVRGDVQNAADDAARAGSDQRTYTAAMTAATQIAAEDLSGRCLDGPTVTGPPPDTFTAGGVFTLQIDCATSLLGLPGLPARKTLTARGIAPLDPYRRTGG
jgi:Flp pilus assembly protein TadG